MWEAFSEMMSFLRLRHDSTCTGQDLPGHLHPGLGAYTREGSTFRAWLTILVGCVLGTTCRGATQYPHAASSNDYDVSRNSHDSEERSIYWNGHRGHSLPYSHIKVFAANAIYCTFRS